MTDLISGRLRSAFAWGASGIVLNDIHRIWQAEGFQANYDAPGFGGQRATLWAQFESSVDWTNADHARRVLRVYESVLMEFAGEHSERYLKALAVEGFTVDEHHRISRVGATFEALSGLEGLRDAAGIMEALNRASALLDRDPAGVVGAVKELIEATSKTVLEAMGETIAKDEDLTSLIKRTQVALGLSPSTVRDDLDSAGSIKKVLGGLSGIAIGLTELRNSDGSGHGRSRGTRLSPRHARLAVNGARAWCEIVLDTYGDPNAPWRKTTS